MKICGKTSINSEPDKNCIVCNICDKQFASPKSLKLYMTNCGKGNVQFVRVTTLF